MKRNVNALKTHVKRLSKAAIFCVRSKASGTFEAIDCAVNWIFFHFVLYIVSIKKFRHNSVFRVVFILNGLASETANFFFGIIKLFSTVK